MRSADHRPSRGPPYDGKEGPPGTSHIMDLFSRCPLALNRHVLSPPGVFRKVGFRLILRSWALGAPTVALLTPVLSDRVSDRQDFRYVNTASTRR